MKKYLYKIDQGMSKYEISIQKQIIEKFERNPNKKVYIEKLHLYNELKDAGQILLGKIGT